MRRVTFDRLRCLCFCFPAAPALALVGFAVAAAVCRPAAAQDTRTVTEPVFPPSCAVLSAELTETDNQLPSGDETQFDTGSIQSALNACASGQAVELGLGSGGGNAFLIQPITIPEGVTLLVDAGVTVYGSRDPRDYDAVAGECGTVDSSGNGCKPLIAVNAANAAIMGYGVIDGRGGQTLLGSGAPANTSWWQLANEAQSEGLSQNNPRLVDVNANSFTLYKITLQNSPMFHVNYAGNGLTVWDVKIVAPGTARNTDGIDPGPAQNVTIANSYIGDGDDNIALKPGGAPVSGGTASNMTIAHNHFYVGHGMSIGSQTSGGSTNVLVEDLDIDGDPTNSNDTGIRIKTASSEGGIIDGVTYRDVCMQNVATPITFNPFYTSATGTDYPQFENILLSNVTVLTPGTVQLEGYSPAYPLGLTLDNVNFSPALPSGDATAANANIALGPGPVNIPVTANAANNVTVTNNVSSSEPPYACTSANFPTMAAEFFPSASEAAPNSPITLTAIFEPVIESPTTFAFTQPTGTVQFFDGTAGIGTVTLSGSTDLATLTLNSEAAGTHNYSAAYSGDAHYASLTTSAATVTVTALASSSQLTVSPSQAAQGAAVTLTAAVSSTAGGTPTGEVNFFDGVSLLGSVELSAGGVAALNVTTLPVGSGSLTAVYQGDADYAGSTSAIETVTITNAPTTTLLTASSTAINAGQPVTLTATVSGGAGTLSGAVTFLDGTATLGTVSLNADGTATLVAASLAAGTHSIAASYAGAGANPGSVSSAIAIQVEDFTIAAGPSTLNIEPGSSGSSTLTFTPLGGLSGTVSYTCSGSASYLACAGGSVTFAGSGPATATINVGVASTIAAGVFALPFFVLFGSGPRRAGGKSRRASRMRLWMLAILVCSLLGLASCGSGGGSTSTGSETPPPGTQTVTVTAAATTSAGTLTHSASITVNVQ